MRHILQEDLNGKISDDWRARARQALDELSTKQPGQRSKFIEDNAELWRELKAALLDVSGGKCWYSEVCHDPGSLAIDHFRPKNRVSRARPKHRGYWWLAFDWRNYRLATGLCNERRKDVREGNTQGKGCLFPLEDETRRVPDAHPAPIDGERPSLLDPCVAADVQLLAYTVEEGKVVEARDARDAPAEHARAERSIYLYHLNEGTLINKRRQLYLDLKYLAGVLDRLERRRPPGGLLAPDDAQQRDATIDRVATKINARAEHSAFARACLRQLGAQPWMQEVLDRA